MEFVGKEVRVRQFRVAGSISTLSGWFEVTADTSLNDIFWAEVEVGSTYIMSASLSTSLGSGEFVGTLSEAALKVHPGTSASSQATW